MYYKCPKCGRLYYSAAKLKDEQLNCDECGTKVEPFEEQAQRICKAANTQTVVHKDLSVE